MSTDGFGMFTEPVYIIANCNLIVLDLLYTHQKPTLQISANIRSEMSLIMVLYLNPGAVDWWPILANNGAPPISQQDGESCSNTT